MTKGLCFAKALAVIRNDEDVGPESGAVDFETLEQFVERAIQMGDIPATKPAPGVMATRPATIPEATPRLVK